MEKNDYTIGGRLICQHDWDLSDLITYALATDPYDVLSEGIGVGGKGIGLFDLSTSAGYVKMAKVIIDRLDEAGLSNHYYQWKDYGSFNPYKYRGPLYMNPILQVQPCIFQKYGDKQCNEVSVSFRPQWMDDDIHEVHFYKEKDVDGWWHAHSYANAVVRALELIVRDEELSMGVYEVHVLPGGCCCKTDYVDVIAWRILLGKNNNTRNRWSCMLERKYNEYRTALAEKGIMIVHPFY